MFDIGSIYYDGRNGQWEYRGEHLDRHYFRKVGSKDFVTRFEGGRYRFDGKASDLDILPKQMAAE